MKEMLKRKLDAKDRRGKRCQEKALERRHYKTLHCWKGCHQVRILNIRGGKAKELNLSLEELGGERDEKSDRIFKTLNGWGKALKEEEGSGMIQYGLDMNSE